LNAAFFPAPPADLPRIAGGAAVAMPAKEEARLITLAPQSSMGGEGLPTAVPVALIVKEAAIAAFGHVLSEGATSESAAAFAGADFVVEPTVRDFSFRYGSPEGGQPFTPFVRLAVQVIARDASGAVRLDRLYETQDYESREQALSAGLIDRQMTRILHIIAFEMMTEAARDLAAATDGAPT
jgi:hypothetical protein